MVNKFNSKIFYSLRDKSYSFAYCKPAQDLFITGQFLQFRYANQPKIYPFSVAREEDFNTRVSRDLLLKSLPTGFTAKIAYPIKMNPDIIKDNSTKGVPKGKI